MEAEKVFDLEDEQERSTYPVDVECFNCKNEKHYYIPFGYTVYSYLKDEKCSKCGCYIIKKKRR